VEGEGVHVHVACQQPCAAQGRLHDLLTLQRKKREVTTHGRGRGGSQTRTEPFGLSGKVTQKPQ
jgi:hypothetical protein